MGAEGNQEIQAAFVLLSKYGTWFILIFVLILATDGGCKSDLIQCHWASLLSKKI